jgi:DNA helicase HerA-like ATPase
MGFPHTRARRLRANQTIRRLVRENKISVDDLVYPMFIAEGKNVKEEIKSISRGLDYSRFEEKKEEPLVWIFVDEAHEFLPMNEKTVATDALVQLLREGRQPGVSLVLATQQPGKIHTDVMTQSDIVISHRVTSSEDLAALNHIMQSYLFEGIKKYMDELPTSKGSAIILDDNSERIYPLRIRPRFTWHGGEAPMAVNPDKKI